MKLIKRTKELILLCFTAFFGTVKQAEDTLLFTRSSCCKKTLQGILGLCLLGCFLGGVRAYNTYRAYEALPSCREKIDYLIHHRFFFTVLLKTKRFTLDLLMHVSNPQKRSASTKLAHWLEGRLVKHLEREDVQSVADLPLLDRSVIRTLDDTSRISGYILTGINSIMSFFGLGN